MLSCSGTDIYYIVCRKHGVFIMLYDNQRISEISQVFQCCQELVIIPLMQSDTGLVQDVGNSHQTGTDLGGKPDPLCLTA